LTQSQPAEPGPAEAAFASVARRLRWRWLALLGLLLVEYVLITFSFDAVPLLRSAGLVGVVGYSGIVTPLAAVVATATFVLAGRSARAEAAQLIARHAAGMHPLPFVLVNVVSYYGFYTLTDTIVCRPFDAPALPTQWIVGWFVLLALTVLSLLPAALPWRALGPLLRQTGKALALGLGVGILAWVAGLASIALWMPLRVSTLACVYFLLSVLGADITYIPDDDIIGTQDFFVSIAPECSGLEGIGLITVFTLVYLWTARDRLLFPRAFGVLPLAIAAVWIGNTLRILALIGVGTLFSPGIALSGFHSKAGWLLFCVVALSMLALVQRSTYFTGRVATDEHPGATWNPTATHVAPLLALIGTSLITGLFSTGFDHAYALRVLTTASVIYIYRKQLPAARWPASWHAPVIGVAVFVAWLLLVPHPAADDVETFKNTLADMPQLERVSWLVFRVVGSTLTVPIAEELAFRAFLLRRLIASEFIEVPKTKLTAFAVVLSSLAFGSLHDHAWLAGTVAGVAYAFAQRARGRTADAIVAHGITNALIALDVLGFGATWLWV
jgi:exosortase E/protease (VPEID-CTERM system)